MSKPLKWTWAASLERIESIIHQVKRRVYMPEREAKMEKETEEAAGAVLEKGEWRAIRPVFARDCLEHGDES